MTQPAAPPDTIGLDPRNADEVNQQVGTHLRGFVNMAETIGHDQDWLLGVDLKVEPYLFAADQETTIKTAIAQLDQALEAVDRTFINRLTGLF